MTDPVFESRLAESRVIVRNQCPLAHRDTEVASAGIRDYLAWILARSQVLPDEFVQAKLFGPPYFDGGLYRWAHCDFVQCNGDVIGCHRLEKRRRQAHLVAF